MAPGISLESTIRTRTTLRVLRRRTRIGRSLCIHTLSFRFRREPWQAPRAGCSTRQKDVLSKNLSWLMKLIRVRPPQAVKEIGNERDRKDSHAAAPHHGRTGGSEGGWRDRRRGAAKA